MRETRQPYGILYDDGTLEVESNDRQLRITLSKTKVFKDDGSQVEMFRSTYYVKDGLEWERTLNSANYNDAEDFLEAISSSEDFTQSVRDIREQQKEREAGG